MNQDLIAWRDMAGRNWITTILSHYGWCTWTTIINGQGIIAEKKYLFVFLKWQLQRVGTYLQLNCDSRSKDRKLISIVCPICLKITLDCWQQIAEVNRLSYSPCNCQIKPNFIPKKPSLYVGDGQKSGNNHSDFITWKESDQTRWKLSKWWIQTRNCEKIKIKSADCLV